MIKSFRWAACLAALALPAWAEPQLYVRNQPFQGPVRWFSTRTLAPLDGLLESLGCNWEFDAGQLRVNCGRTAAGGPPLREPMQISLEGRPVRLEQHLQQDRVFVDVDQVAQAFQCAYRKSSDGDTLDLYAPLLANGLGEGALKGNSEQPHFPVQLHQCQVVAEADGRVRGYLRIANRGDQPLARVLSRVALYRKDGQLLARFSEVVLGLKPGQTAVIQFPPLLARGVAGTPVTRVDFEAR
jgi:hypothetical protein